MGVTFKANTDDIRNSCSLYLTNMLLKYKSKINVYDPRGINQFKDIYGNKVNYYNDIYNCILGCDIIIIAADWDIIKNFNFNSINNENDIYIYDFKSCLNFKNNDINSKIKYWSLG